MRVIHHFAAIAALPLLMLASCGGGGGTDVSAPGSGPDLPAGQVNTYGNTNLPGRFLIPASSGPATVYDLRTGLPSQPPSSPSLGNAWYGSSNNSTVLRVSAAANSTENFDNVRTSDWAKTNSGINVRGETRWPKLSPDGRYVVSFWRDVNESYYNRLSVFDTTNSVIVKRGSVMDGQSILSSPVGWLPDGRYVFLSGRQLYVSSPTAQVDTLIATLNLPDNSVTQNGEFTSRAVHLAVSPDGTKIAFNWATARAAATDNLIWVVNVDGSNLHKLTIPPNAGSAVASNFSNPTWSPDSKWIAGVNFMSGATGAPIFPPDQSFPGVPGGIIGGLGCEKNAVFVLPADAANVPVSWPAYDPNYSVKVRNASGTGGAWVSSCTSLIWLP
ncbi:MAG: hypothetical protein RLZZ618_801 [Pseudomonadota bacterium]|jgi:hypothetical protein